MKGLIAFMLCLAVAGCAGMNDYVDLSGNEGRCAEGPLTVDEGSFECFSIHRLTDFGERPVWSPDGERIAFVDHEFGDAYEYDLATGKSECITCAFDHPGFLRVHYLKDGDYLLLGPKERGNDFTDRVFHTGFWWMPADRSVAPRWIGEEHYEGVAVSRETRTIAYSKTWLDAPFFFPSRMCVAEVTLDGEIVNKRVVYRSAQLIEAQDFFPGDSGLTMARYTPNYEVYGVDFATGKVTNYSRSPASEEPEGMFPDGKFTMMESDRQAMKPGDMDLELYMLALDGAGKDVRRLTRFTDQPGQKASNPSVSPDGRRVAFMMARAPERWTQLTGKGDGIFLLEFCNCGGQ